MTIMGWHTLRGCSGIRCLQEESSAYTTSESISFVCFPLSLTSILYWPYFVGDAVIQTVGPVISSP
jgi:hypothetical protein